MLRTIDLEMRIDNINADMVGIVPSTYTLCHQFEHNAVKLNLLNPEELPIENYETMIVFKSEYNMLGYIVLPENVYEYSITRRYTMKRNLEVQYIFRNRETKEVYIRSNVIKFNIMRSIPPASNADQALTDLLDLIEQGEIVVAIEDGNLTIKDKEGNPVSEWPVDEEGLTAEEDDNPDNVNIVANGSKLTVINDPYLITHSVKAHRIKFKTDPSWAVFPILRAVMYQPSVNRNSQDVEVLINGEVTIPADCLTKDGYLYIALTGYDAEGYIRKTSDYVYVYVHAGVPLNY